MTRNPVVLALLVVLGLTVAACGAATSHINGSGPGDGPDPTPFTHETYFAEYFAAEPPPDVTNLNTVCVECHVQEASDIVTTGHWLWAGTDEAPSVNIEGYETGHHGKVDLLNNFCIAIPSNEGRCTQCHIGVGWVDKDFDFDDTSAIDCLICHDTTGLYGKHPTLGGGGGRPVLNQPSEWPGAHTLLTQEQWESIGAGVGEPSRANCGFCHFKAGGGNNVKHGDLAVNLINTTREYDVHMASVGLDFSCQTCHRADESHGIGGMPLHHVTEGTMMQCDDCHSESGSVGAPDHSAMTGLMPMHVDLLACQACHIPAIGRHTKTKIWWDWSEANQNGTAPIYDDDGYIVYDRKKGIFIWEWNVRPVLRRHDGMWFRRIVGENDTYQSIPIAVETDGPNQGQLVLAEPSAAWAGDSRIYPFKEMIGRQPTDAGNDRLLVPHLFGTRGGDFPYWGQWDWDKALSDGAIYTDLPYSGVPGFVDTVMYLTVNHEVAPSEMALGHDNCCADCHGIDPDTGFSRIEWGFLRSNGQDPWPNPASCD